MLILLALLSIKGEKRLPWYVLINPRDPLRYRVCNINKLQYNNSSRVFLFDLISAIKQLV